ncbi:ArsR/SmtB family transcription factor [Levilactobacillus acidifarinae]|uniref:HTH arsR-type domain-containing protein n=1 Tax=Levilactobacillus acidifarinae DSM 19394 = JCM 15949 TaxID=1423715 RepID=A0A0R1LSZ7_9LACO|nr:helix-turn-helix domain-containing protein [Levilactobacillus acidifarinae]KRK94551.1 hypothetical protein FD25_GL000519 [Levilactobacillus acidifarinae DSM 19394]GEO68300.1 transcriptional regulator [Levilactobacillus acidifarinae]
MPRSNSELNTQVQVFKALADPTRLAILKLLKRAPEALICGQVGAQLGISKTSGSYHFKLLEAAELIIVNKVAREKYVTLNQAVIDRDVTQFYQQL